MLKINAQKFMMDLEIFIKQMLMEMYFKVIRLLFDENVKVVIII